MPTLFRKDCPHCLSKAASFTFVHQWYDRSGQHVAYGTAVCGVCNNGIIVKIRRKANQVIPNLPGSNLNFPTDDLQLVETWPSSDIEKPSDVPPNIDHYYSQGIINLKGRQWDAAGAMFRKSLDVSTKFLDPQSKNLTLFQRIEKLVSNGLLTSAIGDWSHEIRIDGNGSVHDEEPETEEDAQAIQKFTEAFLRYAFTLPSMVAQNRQKRTPAVEPDAPK